MVAVKRIACVLVAASLLVGCARSTSSTYEASDVGRTVETQPATVVSSRIVRVTGDTGNNVGPVAGGALGAAGAGLAFDKFWASVIGAVIGAGAGYVAQQRTGNREGIEYVVEMNDGRTVTLVQNRADNEEPVADGTPVLVQMGGRYTRVVPDPRGAERKRGGGQWVDPDTVGAGAPASTAGSPSPARGTEPSKDNPSGWSRPQQ